ncbi:hypothetical protein ACIOHE_24290 [Streptomyces sp. NPDC087851]|uniref:hypothetical protein n=1 Tax=Streptomyces sp. NPDC087851 TaxID=3365810 RepID=UPI00381860E4
MFAPARHEWDGARGEELEPFVERAQPHPRPALPGWRVLPEAALHRQDPEQGIVGAVGAELVQDREPRAGTAHEPEVFAVVDEAARSLSGLVGLGRRRGDVNSGVVDPQAFDELVGEFHLPVQVAVGEGREEDVPLADAGGLIDRRDDPDVVLDRDGRRPRLPPPSDRPRAHLTKPDKITSCEDSGA